MPRLALIVVLAAGATHLVWQTWQASVPFAADQRNPYVYAQTSPDILNLVSRINALAAVSPQGAQTVIKVMAPEGDFWPLPWYLRRFKQVGWWDNVPSNPFAPLMIVSAKFQANLDEKKTHLMPGVFALRPQILFELYVELDLWKAYLAQSSHAPN